MKMRVREQLICYLFVAILFLTGMCVEIPPADAAFLYAKEAFMTNFTGSIISEGSRLVTLEQVCTISMLERETTTVLSNNRSRNLAKKFLRNVVALFAVAILLSYLFCYGDVAKFASGNSSGSHAIIVRYIQQKDGKK